MTPADLEDLARHMEWADAVVWQVVLRARAARDDARLHGLLHHLHSVQHAFVAVWRGGTPAIPAPADLPAPKALASWGREGLAEILAYLAEVSAETLAQPLRVPWADAIGRAWDIELDDPTLGETALQVALHSGYHRGQINARLRELGVAPENTDFIAWIWRGRPAADWSFLPAR